VTGFPRRGDHKYALANRLLDLRHYDRVLSAEAVAALLCWYDPRCDENHAEAKVAHAIAFRTEPRGCEPATDAERYAPVLEDLRHGS
jgi:hypothetical protein